MYIMIWFINSIWVDVFIINNIEIKLRFDLFVVCINLNSEMGKDMVKSFKVIFFLIKTHYKLLVRIEIKGYMKFY